MKIYYSTFSQLDNDISTSIDNLISAKANHIELLLDGYYWDKFDENSEVISSLLKSKDVDYSVHTPIFDMNLTSENRLSREATIKAYKNTIAFASKINASHVVIHPGTVATGVFSKKRAQQRLDEAIKELCDFNENYNMQLLLENIGDNKTSIFTEQEYIDFIKRSYKNVYSVFDIGHAYVCKWNIEKVINKLGKSLKAIHIHDNDSKVDAHLPIGMGTIDWFVMLNNIKNCDKNMKLILEYNIGIKPQLLLKGKNLISGCFNDSLKIE